MMKRGFVWRLLALASCLGGGSAFQASGCAVGLTPEDFTAILNSGAQNFLNTLFTQWSAVRIENLFT